MTAKSETYDSICHYNPTADMGEVDPAQDCGRAAVWHFLANEGASGGVECYQACDLHQGNALLLDGVEEFHEFGSACGLEGSYWIHDLGMCATETMMVVNGMAWYNVEAYNKPQRPEPGAWAYEMDTGVWRRYLGGLWVESDPAPGASCGRG